MVLLADSTDDVRMGKSIRGDLVVQNRVLVGPQVTDNLQLRSDAMHSLFISCVVDIYKKEKRDDEDIR
jgi:hypothetical protein